MSRQRHRVILLVGFMGAGKTSVGKMLAEQLHGRFVDLDDLVVVREARRSSKKLANPAFAQGRARHCSNY